MAPLSTAFVRLRPVLSESEVRSASARAGAAGGAVMGREFNSALRRTSRVLVGLGIGTFAAEAGRFALDMADKFELSRSRLETVTKNLGGDFSALSGQVQAVDDKMAKLGFSSADVEGSIASLETATKSTTKAIADQALAADIARGRNITLETATQILMRVETGHVAMLSRLGIATKDANGHLLTQAAALKQLAAIYGGSASHFAETFAGKQQALRAELANSAAQIGVALLPAFVDLANVLQHDVLPPIEHAAQFFDRNRKTIEPLIGTLLKLVIAYKAVRIAQRAATAFNVGKVAAGAVERGAVGAGALEAFSLARPLPVYVVNGLKGAGVPGAVTTAEKDAVKTGEATAKGFVGKVLESPVARFLGTAVGLDAVGRIFASGAASARSGSTVNDIGQRVQTGSVSPLSPHGVPIPVGKFGSVNIPAGMPGGPALAHAASTVKAAADKAASGEKNLGAQTQHATVSLKQQAQALAQAQSRSLALAGAQDDLRAAIHNMATSVTAGKTALAGNSDAALANRAALRGAVQSAESYVQTLQAQGVGHRKVAAAAAAMSAAIEKNATSVYGDKGAVDHLLKSLDFLPGQIIASMSVAKTLAFQLGQQIDSSIAAGIGAFASIPEGQAGVVAAQIGKAAGFGARADNPGAGSGPGNTVVPASPTAATQQSAINYGKKIGKSVSDGYSPVVDKGVSAATSKAFQHAQSIMQTDLGNIKSFLASQKQTIFSAFSSLDTSPQTDSLGASGPSKAILGQLNANAKLADQFTRLFIRLDNAGATPRVLDMFESLGPAAIPTMRLWLSHPRKLRQANRDLRRIGADAARVGERATEDKFGPLIHHDLEKLPHKLERAFVQALRHERIYISTDDHARHRARKVRSS